MGTRIEGLQVVRVIDGDTIRVVMPNGEEESLRLAGVDTEESQPGAATPDKPVTEAGKAASEMAKAYFATAGGGLAQVDLEFETDGPVDTTALRFRDNYGRLLCYIHKGAENYNLKLVREGWSPYFVKYGRSRLYHAELLAAEARAQAEERVIWNPTTNGGGATRPYERLIPWWDRRAAIVEDFRRRDPDAGVLSVRLDYERILALMDGDRDATILCDLQAGINQWTGGGAVIFAGSVQHPLNLWIDDVTTDAAHLILRLIDKRYGGTGQRNYVYVTGRVEAYRGRPQIVLTDPAQLSDLPTG